MTELTILALDIPLMPSCQFEWHLTNATSIDHISACLQNSRPIITSQLISGRELLQPQQKEQLANIGCQAEVIDFNPLSLGISIQLKGIQLQALSNINKQGELWLAHPKALEFNSQPIAASVLDALIRLYETLKLHPYLRRQKFVPNYTDPDQLLNFLCMWLPLAASQRLQLMQASNSISRAQYLFDCLQQIEQQFDPQRF